MAQMEKEAGVLAKNNPINRAFDFQVLGDVPLWFFLFRDPEIVSLLQHWAMIGHGAEVPRSRSLARNPVAFAA